MNQSEYMPMLHAFNRYTKAWEKSINAAKEKLEDKGVELLELDPGIHLDHELLIEEVFQLIFDNGSWILPWVTEEDAVDKRVLAELRAKIMELMEAHCNLDYSAHVDSANAAGVELPPEEYEPIAPTLVLTTAVLQSTLSAVPAVIAPFSGIDPSATDNAQRIVRTTQNLSFLLYQLGDALDAVGTLLDPEGEIFNERSED